MANQDRLERYSKIRRFLDDPFAQRPNADKILNQMLTDEQGLNLRLTNSRQPWNLISATISALSGTGTYAITQPTETYQNSGKVYFVVRSTGQDEQPSVPVPFDDFSDLDYGQMPGSGVVNQILSVPEKISFYRSSIQGQTINAVIQPVPQESLTYTVWFFAGSLDRSRALMSGTGPVTELSDYLDLNSAAALLPYAEWRDDDGYNENKRRTLAVGLTAQIARLEPIVEKYIRNINSEKTFTMDYWDD